VNSELPIKHYKKNQDEGFFNLLRAGFKNIASSNYLAFQLAKRDISAQYRQSILGLLWSIILPMTTAGLWIFLKGSSTVDLKDTGMNYTLYVFIGTMAWAIITESIMGPINSTLAMRGTLAKINFPKEALIISSAYKTLFNTATKLIILILLLIYFQQPIGPFLLLFPVALFIILFFGVALGTLITPFGLLYGDVGKLMSPVLQILMYLSPVVFAMPQSQEGIYNTLVSINPLSSLVVNFRNTLLSQPLDHVAYYFSILGISFIVFCIALVIFRITIPIITERLSA
jgi:lipopolysaccharide transport system permease protein